MLKVIICQSDMLRLSPKHLRLVQMEFYNTKQIQQENYQYQTKYKHSWENISNNPRCCSCGCSIMSYNNNRWKNSQGLKWQLARPSKITLMLRVAARIKKCSTPKQYNIHMFEKEHIRSSMKQNMQWAWACKHTSPKLLPPKATYSITCQRDHQ